VKRINKLFFLVLVIFIGAGCTSIKPHTVTQVSTMDAIVAGFYDGQLSCRDLLSYGDFGIGSFDRLDGEMIILDGKIYQAKADGKVYLSKLNQTTPFASVVKFYPDMVISVNEKTDLIGLEKLIDDKLANQNIFYAIKIKGHFISIKNRSVPAQEKPYPALVKVTENQVVFISQDIYGTIVGFKSPGFIKGINVPGYHLHFISSDFKSGGHTLELIMDKGTIEIEKLNKFFMILPEDNSFSQIDLTQDRSADLEKAEK
jgi:acetolactate decarboxylase